MTDYAGYLGTSMDGNNSCLFITKVTINGYQNMDDKRTYKIRIKVNPGIDRWVGHFFTIISTHHI